MVEPEKLVELLVFVSERPVSSEYMKNFIGNNEFDVPAAVKNLNAKYEAAGLSFRIEMIGDGYSFATLPEYDEHVTKFLKEFVKPRRLTRAAIEVLSIVAYKQPVKRQEIDSIRGAGSQDILKLLLEQDLISVSGREKGTGALMYKTTDKFLQTLGLASISELPKPEEL